MRNRSRARAALILALAAPFSLGAAPAAGPGAEVSITVTGLRSGEGVVRACMTTHEDRFPRCRGDEDAYRLVVPADGEVTLDFGRVRPGRYAIALLHDENDNGKADRALSMIPREGFGFSRDAKVRLGPPKFEDAAIAVDGRPVHASIRMRYML